MLRLKKRISVNKGLALTSEIKEFIQKQPRIFCKALNKRPVFLIKYLEATHGRRDQTRRRQKFLGAVELLRRAKPGDITNRMKEPGGELAFEIKGIMAGGESIGVHIRQEIEGKDKKLYLISTF